MAKPKHDKPKPPPESGPDLVQDQAGEAIPEVQESSSASAGGDLSAHPKFAKFKTPRGEK